MRVTWLASVLRDAGLPVYEDPGWKGRGRDLTSVAGVVWHHTATGPRWTDGHVLALLRHGHRDLAGPLAQLGLERDGTWVCVADGRANHNGYGRWGNQSIGVEAYNDGLGEPWPRAQLDSYHEGTAAILRRLGAGADRVLGHRETDPRRKIDPTGIDMDAARARIASLLSGHPRHTPPPPTDQELTVAQIDDLIARLDGLERAQNRNYAAVLNLGAIVLELRDELIAPVGKGGDTRADRMATVPKAVEDLTRAVKDLADTVGG